MNAYSKDLRLKTLAALDRGLTKGEVVETFGISLATLKRWLSEPIKTLMRDLSCS